MQAEVLWWIPQQTDFYILSDKYIFQLTFWEERFLCSEKERNRHIGKYFDHPKFYMIIWLNHTTVASNDWHWLEHARECPLSAAHHCHQPLFHATVNHTYSIIFLMIFCIIYFFHSDTHRYTMEEQKCYILKLGKVFIFYVGDAITFIELSYLLCMTYHHVRRS